MLRILFIRASEITTLPLCATAPPHSPVLPPWGTMAMPPATQARTTSATSAVEPGRTTASVSPWHSPRVSARYGVMASPSATQPRSPTMDLMRASASLLDVMAQSFHKSGRSGAESLPALGTELAGGAGAAAEAPVVDVRAIAEIA